MCEPSERNLQIWMVQDLYLMEWNLLEKIQMSQKRRAKKRYNVHVKLFPRLIPSEF